MIKTCNNCAHEEDETSDICDDCAKEVVYKITEVIGNPPKWKEAQPKETPPAVEKDCDTCAHHNKGKNPVCEECINRGMFSPRRTPSMWEPSGPMVSEIFPDCTWDEAMEIAGNKGEGWYLPAPWELAVMYKAKTLGREELQDMHSRFWTPAVDVCLDGGGYYGYVDFVDGYTSYTHKERGKNARFVRAGYIDSLVKWILEKEGKK